MAQFLKGINHHLFQECQIGVDVLCSWIKIIKAVRRTSLAEKGRGDGYLVPLHVDACYQLMEVFKEFDNQLGKNCANRCNVKPAGVKHLELVKDLVKENFLVKVIFQQQLTRTSN